MSYLWLILLYNGCTIDRCYECTMVVLLVDTINVQWLYYWGTLYMYNGCTFDGNYKCIMVVQLMGTSLSSQNLFPEGNLHVSLLTGLTVTTKFSCTKHELRILFLLTYLRCLIKLICGFSSYYKIVTQLL